MDRLQAMTVFARVVELGSFARAAERLGISTSAASRHVAELEDHLGTRLLQRTTRRLSLTESGVAFHERIVPLLADLDEAELAASASTAELRGTLRITCGIAWGALRLAPAIAAFSTRHPEIRFDVDFSARIVDLVEEGFDLAIRVGPVAPTMIARPIGTTSLVACASPGYLRRAGTPRNPADLAAHACMLYAYATAQDTWTFSDESGAEQSVRVRGPLRMNSGEVNVRLAELGMGIAYEPDFIAAPLLADGRLVRVLAGYHGPTVPIQAVYASRRHLSAKVRSFVGFLAEHATPVDQRAAARVIVDTTQFGSPRRRRAAPRSRP
jgi:DNA-binding transcriptional LysR family regulator